jgi:hypothetical protein
MENLMPEGLAFMPLCQQTLDLRDLNRTFSASDLADAIDKSDILFVSGPGDDDGQFLKGEPCDQMRAAIAAGADQLIILTVMVANKIQVEHIEAAVEWIGDGMFGDDQIRDWGNQIVAAFGRGEVH